MFIKKYIRNQLQEDMVSDQITMKEFIDPFAVEKEPEKKKGFLK